MVVIILIALMIAGVSVFDFLDSRNWQSPTSDTRNSIIFEHKNKKYGAYSIRKDYNLVLTVILAGLILLLAVIFFIRAIIFSVPIPIEIPKIPDEEMIVLAPPIQEIKSVDEPYKITGGGGGGSAGAASVNPIDKTPEEQSKQEPTIKESDNSVNSGRSDVTNSNNPNKNPATTLIKGKSPFGGGAARSGNGSGIMGKDLGPGSGTGDGNGINGHGSGTGGGGPRKLLSSLSLENFQSNENCTVALFLYVNAEGIVVRAENNRAVTTTTDARLIGKIIELAKQQVRYDKRPGSGIEKISKSWGIKAT